MRGIRAATRWESDGMPPRKRAPAKRGALAAVPDDAPPPEKPKPLTLEQAIESGSYLEILLAQRRQMVKDLKSVGTGGPAAAALHRQFGLVSQQIAMLEAEAKDQADQDADEAEADEPFSASDL